MNDNVKEVAKPIFFILLSAFMIAAFFTFAFFTTEAASSDPPSDSIVQDFPLPYGPGSGYGYGTFPLTQEIVDGAIAYGFEDEPTWFLDGYTLATYEIDDDNAYMDFRLMGHLDGAAIVDGRNLSPLGSSSSIGLARNKVLEIRYTVSTGSYSVRYRGSGNSTSYCSVGSALTSLPTTGLYLPQGTFIQNYPLAFSEGTSLVYDNVTLFQVYTPGSGSLTPGEVTTYPNLDPLTGDPSSGQDNSGLFSLLKSWLSTLNGTIWNSGKNQNDNLMSFFKPYLDSFQESIQDKQQMMDQLKEIVDELYNAGYNSSTGKWNLFTFLNVTVLQIPTGQQIHTMWQQTSLGQFVTSAQYYTNTLATSIGNTPAAVNLRFVIPFQWNVATPSMGPNSGVHQDSEIVLDFGWYNDVRDTVLPILLCFLYIGFGIYLLKRVPDILNGASGSYDHVEAEVDRSVKSGH